MTFRIINTREAVGPNGIRYVHDAARPFAVLFDKGRGEMCALRCPTEACRQGRSHKIHGSPRSLRCPTGGVMFRTNHCDKCDAPTANPENEYGEFVCEDCLQNASEAAWERHCEAFHDGGATQFRSLRDQQIDAMKLK